MADTAADVLVRLLELLALASRPGGVGLEEASARLGREPRRLVDDLRLAANREHYHPPGWVDDLRIEIAPDRVEVWTSQKFDRPPGLTRLEALSLSLALRAAAAQRPEAERPELLELATRLDAGIASGSVEELLPMISLEDGSDPDGYRRLLERAIRERRSCRIRYVGSSDPQPDVRGVDPYGLVYGNGTWYLVGRCERSGATKVFRLDRVIAAELLDERFDRPDDLNLQSFVEGGRVFTAHETRPVTVRYSKGVSDWVREKGPVREGPGGEVFVDYAIADPHWVVRHVLRYGPEAMVVEPEEVRGLVIESLRTQLV
jgi:predicted DNA-binding transcriptional regulator YafY